MLPIPPFRGTISTTIDLEQIFYVNHPRFFSGFPTICLRFSFRKSKYLWRKNSRSRSVKFVRRKMWETANKKKRRTNHGKTNEEMKKLCLTNTGSFFSKRDVTEDPRWQGLQKRVSTINVGKKMVWKVEVMGGFLEDHPPRTYTVYVVNRTPQKKRDLLTFTITMVINQPRIQVPSWVSSKLASPRKVPPTVKLPPAEPAEFVSDR